MKKPALLIASLFCILSAFAQQGAKVSYFDLQDVRLLNSPFKHAEELDKKYLLELNADRLLAPFVREAGLPKKADSYTNWENTGLDGHIGGHYLSALSLMHASTGDAAIKERLDYMVGELKRCQDANGNGYIGGVPGGKTIWDEIAAGNIQASGFGLNNRWVPLYNIHKTYAGLRDAYLVAGNRTAKEMLVKMTDWAIKLVSALSEDQIQDMLRSEHGGLNETFADVAAITGDEKYLKLARQFSHQSILNPLLNHEDKLTGMHANTQIPKVLGFKRIADIEGNESWSEAARFFWETVVEHRSICIGGNSVHEHFHPANDFSGMITSNEGPETCNTYNMLRLSKMLYQTSLDKKYMDYYERALYNHILSSQNPNGGGLVYFTQMRPGHYRVYSQPHTSMWCCVGSGIENHAKYGEMIYAHTGSELYVNLFIPSMLNWRDKDVEVVQENSFPDKASTLLTINPKKATAFTLKLRYPSWIKGGKFSVRVNNKEYSAALDATGYLSINRTWKKGDRVSVEMPMEIFAEQMPDKSNYYSIFYGPIALAAKSGSEDLQGLFADDSRGGHVAHGRQLALKDMPIIVSEPDKIASRISPVEGKPLTFTLSNLYSEKYPKTMELIPFFRLHESRYIIYWPQATANEVQKLQEKIAKDEKERMALDAITIDKVVCGEQQPESDHFVQMEKSNAGFFEDIHWREAKGWFSYRMKNPDKRAKSLYLKYFDRDKSRSFDILVNDVPVSSMMLNGGEAAPQYTIIEIPESELNKQSLAVKIMAKDNSTTGKMVEVRLLNLNKNL
ncbi:glycoside hydrolase family 127 protein [Dysgonomonas sp. 511]|uniref:glycoside hydrolase family 127 protein n=1 Tax=Dysgonomonas sp. 511 TaxID=2302930 RepID=UPI0013D4C50A|nr:glycoside hydrolase family 127 protein [Dysgonomonas sp. 511]NDV77907.1 glycosyl hydrolase [Dysgonomonas sp. 511]